MNLITDLAGFADNKDDHLTWKILTADTNQIITRSAVRSATKTTPNLWLDPPKGEDQPQDLTSDVFVYGRPRPDGSEDTPHMFIINLMTYWGEHFYFTDENGERKRATISDHVNIINQDQVSREDQLRFKLKLMETNLMILSYPSYGIPRRHYRHWTTGKWTLQIQMHKRS